MLLLKGPTLWVFCWYEVKGIKLGSALQPNNTKQDENEGKETSKFKKGKPGNKKKPYGKNKIVYTMEDSEYFDGSEVEETEVLFMGLDTHASNSDSNV